MKKKSRQQVKAKIANNEVGGQTTDGDSFSVEGKVGELQAIAGSEGPPAANLQEQLATFEKIIGSAQKQFEDVGRALHFINEDKLYKDSFQEFEEYCRQKWDLADKHAYRLINSYRAMKVLRAASIDDHLLPRNEYQVRVLLELSEENEWEANWKRVIEAANDDPSGITGGLVVKTLGDEKSPKSDRKNHTDVLSKVLNWIKKDKEKLDSLEAAKKLLGKIEKELESLRTKA